MKVLVDTNIFLDVLLDRKGLTEESQRLLDWCDAHPGDAWIAWHTLSNLYYIGARCSGKSEALAQIDAILNVFEVCPCGSREARAARALPLADFEDALQVAAAMAGDIDWIVSRNKKDFRNSPVPALLPGEFLRKLR